MRVQLPCEKEAAGLPSMAFLGSPPDNDDDAIAKLLLDRAKFIPMTVNKITICMHSWIDVNVRPCVRACARTYLCMYKMSVTGVWGDSTCVGV